MNSSIKRILLFASLFLLAGAVENALAASVSRNVYRVEHVSDGDTLVLENGWKVRLLGIDTPEMADKGRNGTNAHRFGLDEKIVNQFAAKAKAFLKSKVEGQEVRLEYDWQKTDKYGRHLAYVYRQKDNFFVNAEILRQGYGFVYVYFPFKESERFRNYAEEARKSRRGLWKT